MTRILPLSPVASLTSLTGDGELVAFDAGPDGLIYLVIALRPLDYRIEKLGAASFANTVPDQPQRYRVIGLSGTDPVLDVVIERERFNIHHVQPLVDELLLVCARSYFRKPDDFEKNGRVYSREGKFAREILLGDGLRSVQTTSEGVIWTSFFDEGVFGNYGWESPVGSSGLVAWNSFGKKLYEFQPGPGLDSICDCYALNVASIEDVWCYYYTEFPLVHLRSQEIKSIWKMPLGGSDAFAISAEHALFRGGYQDQDTYQLFSLGPNGEARMVTKIQLQDQNGDKLIANRAVGRGEVIHLASNGYLYHIDMQTSLAVASERGH
jgi:hypothetical protein